MVEDRNIKKRGHSICVLLDRGTLKNVYNLDVGDEVLVDYAYPDIIITPKCKVTPIVKKEKN